MRATRLFAFLVLCGAVLPGVVPAKAGQVNQDGGQNAAQAIEKDLRKREKHARPAPVAIADRQFAYIRANLISTLYHEFAHALIDQLDLPVYGQEEDAADVLAALMLDYQFGNADVEAIARLTAQGFRDEAREREESDGDWIWADVHGPEWQRYYNFVCLHFGRYPERRHQFAEDMKLPQERAKSCVDENALARRSWGKVLDRVKAGEGAHGTIVFESRARRLLQKRSAEVIRKEVERLNRLYRLPHRLRVTVRRCGEDSPLSAYYTEGRARITICTEYISELNGRAQSLPDL